MSTDQTGPTKKGTLGIIEVMGLKLGILGITLLILAFQNCAHPNDGPEQPQNSGSESVVGLASTYKKFTYDPQLESNQVSSSRLTVDLATGGMTLGLKSCSVDSVRINQFRQIFQTAKICQPVAPPGAVNCLAVGVADIQLSNGAQHINLRPVICNYGIYFCEGLDSEFRNLVKDVSRNPPSACI